MAETTAQKIYAALRTQGWISAKSRLKGSVEYLDHKRFGRIRTDEQGLTLSASYRGNWSIPKRYLLAEEMRQALQFKGISSQLIGYDVFIPWIQ